jgi:uncharacterized protein
MKHERVVFDTNVLISALLFASSTPAQALELAFRNGQLVATSATMSELTTKLRSTKFDRYVSQHARDALLIRLTGLMELVDVVDQIRASRDPKDDKFLEAAVNGRADVLVSGDRDLLDLNPFREIQILPPRDYLRREK